MKEITYNTAITMTKKDLIKNGISYVLEPISSSLFHACKNEFLDLILEDLKDEGNDYQFILTIKQLVKENE